MKLFSFIYILLLVLNFRAFGQCAVSVELSGYTISDVCHGFICHGPIVAEYTIIDSKEEVLKKSVSKDKAEGQFRINGLCSGKEYKFIISDSNFLYFEYNFKIPEEFKYLQISKDFLVYPRGEGVEILFNVSPFEFRKSRIRPGIDYYLDGFVELIKFNPSVKFEIVSFPDDDDNLQKNGELTFNRCFNIRNYFIDKGIEENRILYLPNSNTDPKNPPYDFKTAKGKRYVGSTYLVIRLD